MKKYSELRHIVYEYLDGELDKLKIEYEDDDTMRVEVAYVDKDLYHLFYIVDVHQLEETLQYKEHYCNYGRDFITLKPNKPFEASLKKYLFNEKTTL